MNELEKLKNELNGRAIIEGILSIVGFYFGGLMLANMVRNSTLAECANAVLTRTSEGE